MVLPAWDKIAIDEKAEKAVSDAIALSREQVLVRLKQGPPYTWDNFVRVLDEADDRVMSAFSPLEHLMSVAKVPDEESVKKQSEVLEHAVSQLSAYGSEMAQNEQIYEAYKAISESPEFAKLSEPKRTSVKNTLRDLRLSGAGLSSEKKKELEAISLRATLLGQKFESNISTSERAWKKCVTDDTTLSGIPEDVVRSMKEAARSEKECKGALVTLEEGTVTAVLSFADSRELRHDVLRAYNTRASDIGPGGKRYDNAQIIQEILALRHREAILLGFKNYAELSLAPKMARSTDEVTAFLHSFAVKAKPAAKEEFARVSLFAKETDGISKLEAWDVSYYHRRLKEATFSFTEEEVRGYFPLEKVLSGLWNVTGKLYGVTVAERTDMPVWHKDVRFFEISRDGQVVGALYLDLFGRAGTKRGGAWMDVMSLRSKMPDGTIRLPVGLIVANLKNPPEGELALLTMRDVETLFHEFGHNLQHILTRMDVPGVSGPHGVPWDGIEFPSQFMENFVLNREVMDMISGHYKTGKVLPDELFGKLLASEKFGAATFLDRQLMQSLYDFRLHLEYVPGKQAPTLTLFHDIASDLLPYGIPSWSRWSNGFGHIFAGGYAAGYYSYLWADTLAVDGYAAFVKADGTIDWSIGKRFEDEILSRGGSRPFMDDFIAFRGRTPDVGPLFQKYGLTK